VQGLETLVQLVQLVLFVVRTGYGFLRRWSSSQGARAIAPSTWADQAEVIAPFDGAGFGRVRWQGQSWAALNLDPAQGLAIGDRVTVLGREGTRLQVMGREGPGGWLQSEGDKAPETSISRKPWS